MKGLVSANVVTRLGNGLTVATDQSRGSTVVGRVRMGSVIEHLREWGLAGGLGWSCIDSGSGPVFDVSATTDRTGTTLFTPQSGSVQAIEYVRAMPEATRVVVGGDGDAASRTFRAVIDSAAETAWGLARERLVDERQTTNATELDQAGDDYLAEHGDVTSVKLDVRDIPGQEYGTHYQLGDTVPVLVADDTTFSDVVWQVRVSWSADAGLVFSPVVGKQEDERTTARLRELGKALRLLQEAK